MYVFIVIPVFGAAPTTLPNHSLKLHYIASLLNFPSILIFDYKINTDLLSKLQLVMTYGGRVFL